MMGWQWQQLDHMQAICISLQADNHASTSPLSLLSLVIRKGRLRWLGHAEWKDDTEWIKRSTVMEIERVRQRRRPRKTR